MDSPKHPPRDLRPSKTPPLPSLYLDRFSASLRKWGGNTNTLRAPNWTSKPLFAEYSHYDYHVGHRFGLCNTKTLCFWWETGFTPKTHSEITSWVSSSHLGHFSISGFLIYVVWICHLLVSYFFTTALCNLSGWLEMTIQVKMQYFKSLFFKSRRSDIGRWWKREKTGIVMQPRFELFHRLHLPRSRDKPRDHSHWDIDARLRQPLLGPPSCNWCDKAKGFEICNDGNLRAFTMTSVVLQKTWRRGVSRGKTM